MKNVRLTTTGNQRTVLINWSNVDFVTESTSPYGDDYREVHMGKQRLQVLETMEMIEKQLSDGCSLDLLEEEAKQYYNTNENGTTTEKL